MIESVAMPRDHEQRRVGELGRPVTSTESPVITISAPVRFAGRCSHA